MAEFLELYKVPIILLTLFILIALFIVYANLKEKKEDKDNDYIYFIREEVGFKENK